MKRTRIKSCSLHHRSELAEYRIESPKYLDAHPWCEIFLAEHGLLLSDVSESGWADIRSPEEKRDGVCVGRRVHVPRSIEVHHRNGRNGRERLLNQAFWMAVHRSSHNHIKDHQSWARRRGYLLPSNARPDGTYPGTEVILTTDQLLIVQHNLFSAQSSLDGLPCIRLKPFCFFA